ncbi:MAG TPA: trehalose-phosphatase [Rhizomicrobium sp.]|jgi:trehalose 6-phosphate phosphatase|nr:trehalose-phosphatase [Rhizomicrobium sp.]
MMPPVNGNTALFLDIDGTLLDLARTPDRVKVPHDLLRALERLSRELSGAFAFVSGRSLESIDKLFSPFRPAAIGAHGGEIRGADGVVARKPALPDSVRAVFTGLAKNIPGLLLEDKKCALALHYRLAPEARPVLTSAMEKHAKLFESEKINILHGKAVIEARPLGVDKGTAVAALARQKPFAGRAILFGGDDATDLDVFRILPGLGGRGFSVGRHFPGAEHVFESPRAVRQWLSRTAETGVR